MIGQAIPFIINSDKGFTLSPEAVSFLQGLASPIGIITVVGKYRTGKSLFINKVLLNSQKNGFNVGPTVNPCTKGLWLWKQTIKADNAEFPDQEVIVVDSEGFGGTDEHSNNNNDSKILMFALLLSSFFIYNSVGSIDENSLNCLALIINLAKEVQSRAGEEADCYFPSFLWVIRDFTLQIVDKDGCPMGSKEYLEKALQIQKGVSDAVQNKNKLRRMFKHFFKDRDCATLVRPVQAQESLQKLNTLQQSEIRPQFMEQVRLLRKKIFKKVKPKQMHSKILTGPMLLELAASYVETVNNGGLPNIESAWKYVRKRECQKAKNTALTSIKQGLSKLTEKLSESEVKSLKKSLIDESFEVYRKKAIGTEEQLKPYLAQLKQQAKKYLMDFKLNNMSKWNSYYDSTFSELTHQLKSSIQQDKISSIYDYKRMMAQARDQYLKKCLDGPGKSQFLKQAQLKFSNQHIVRVISTAQAKRTKEAQLAMLRCQRLEEDRKQDKKQIREYEQRIWELEKSLQQRTDDIDQQQRKAEQIALTFRMEVQRLQAETIQRKNQQERLQGQCQYLRKLVEDSKVRLQTMTSRMIEMEINKKQTLQQSKHYLRDIDNLKYNMANREQEIANLKKQLSKAHEAYEKQKVRQNRLSDNNTKLKVDLEVASQELQELRQKHSTLSKEHDVLALQKYEIQQQYRQERERFEEMNRNHQENYQILQQNIEKEHMVKQQLTETNRNLSSAVARMEQRTKQAEEKIESLKEYKKAMKNAICLQCQHCSKFIACPIFTQHLNLCGKEANSDVLMEKKLSGSKIEPLEVTISQTLVRECDNKPYTEYVIEVSRGAVRWTITRKYKTFCELHNSLRLALPGVLLSQVSFIVNPQEGNRKSLVIEERRRLLQRYLRDISQNELVMKDRVFIDFMELPKENNPLEGSIEQGLLPQTPEEFLKSWNERNMRVKETASRKPIGSVFRS